MARLWGVVYTSNLLGCVAFVGVIVAIGEPMGIAALSSFGSLADALLGFPLWGSSFPVFSRAG